jgi:hypothetical protein
MDIANKFTDGVSIYFGMGVLYIWEINQYLVYIASKTHNAYPFSFKVSHLIYKRTTLED